MVRGKDGRIHLQDGYKDIIISRQHKKQLEDVINRAKQISNLRQVESESNNAVTVENMTLFDIPVWQRPNKEDIVSDLLRDLFYDTQNYQKKSRICFLGEYFKFFAGKYSKSELSYQYMKDMMESPSETAFEEKMKLAIGQGKAEFLVHKLIQYIEDKTILKDIPYVLKRCIIINDAIYRDWVQRQKYTASPIDFDQNDQFKTIYMNLLLVDKKSIVTNAQELDRVIAFYEENKQYAWLASSLALTISEEYDMMFVYGQKMYNMLRQNLISRFIADELTNNPFEIDKILAIPMLKSMYSVNWDKQFKDYIRNCPEPMSWLYILFKPSGNLLDWNFEYYHYLVGDGALSGYAFNTLGLNLSQELSSDLIKISGIHNGAALRSATFNDHPFLIEARKWWDTKEVKESKS